MPPEDLAAEIGPEFWREIHETVVSHIGPKMHEDRTFGATCRRIVDIGESGTHRTAEKIVKVERIPPRVSADHDSTTDGVADTVHQ